MCQSHIVSCACTREWSLPGYMNYTWHQSGISTKWMTKWQVPAIWFLTLWMYLGPVQDLDHLMTLFIMAAVPQEGKAEVGQIALGAQHRHVN
jgi:hypothetical protein